MSGITPGWGSQWDTLATAITSWFGNGIESDAYQKVVQMLNSGDYTMEQMDSILSQIPEFNRTYNANGELIGVSYKANVATNTASTVAQEINSNANAVARSQFQTVQTITKNPETQTVTMSDTLTKYKAGTQTTAKAVASSAIAALLATSAGITVGKEFDRLLYNLNPDFWDDHNMQSLNPETWASITAGNNSLGAKLFNFIFGIDPETGNPQPYMDETTFAYMVAYMASMGVFNVPGYTTTITDEVRQQLPDPTIPLTFPISDSEITALFFLNSQLTNPITYHVYTTTHTAPVYATVFCRITNDTPPLQCRGFHWLLASTQPFSGYNDYGTAHVPIQSQSVNVLGESIHIAYTSITQLMYVGTLPPYGEYSQSGTMTANFRNSLAYAMTYGDREKESSIDGINNQTGAIIFNPSGIADLSNINDVLAALQNQYPDLWNDRIEVSPNGNTIIKYIPVAFPTGGQGNQPTTGGATQPETAPDITGDGDNATDELIKTLIDMIQNPENQSGIEPDTESPPKPVNPNPVDTGTGDTPPLIIPTGSASALYSIYNPTQSQLNDFGSWLWSSSFVDQLLKLFNDPMQAIIGLHKVFAPPPISGNGTIKVGYLDSEVPSKLVGGQYVDIPCGTVSLREYFGNVFDYDPHTQVNIYLPFIGIQRLDVGDVMRGDITVLYHVDVITGACLAEIKVNRDLAGGTLYTYSGNCAVQYPISSGSYMGIVASAASIAGGIVGTIATGGALAPVAMGAVSGVLNAHTRVQHSGSFTGNAGAMGIKKPYLIITRPQTALAENFEMFDGYPANENVTLSQCSGFVKCRTVHLENINATETELNEIETLLTSGVLI